jgi:hypothetical protein
MTITDIFSNTRTEVFRVTNFYEAKGINDHLIEPTEYKLIPENQHDTYIYVRALQVFEDHVEECFMDLSLTDRLPEFVIKKTDNKIFVTPIYDEQNSVIPAIASEQCGNPELYFAKENPAIGIEVLKRGKILKPDSEAIKDDLAYIYDMIGKRKKKVAGIKSTEDAITLFIEQSVIHFNAQYEGNTKAVNNTHNKIKKITTYLKDSDQLPALEALLNHENEVVKFTAAIELLFHNKFHNKSIKVMEELQKSSDLLKLDAKYFLMELKDDESKG